MWWFWSSPDLGSCAYGLAGKILDTAKHIREMIPVTREGSNVTFYYNAFGRGIVLF